MIRSPKHALTQVLCYILQDDVMAEEAKVLSTPPADLVLRISQLEKIYPAPLLTSGGTAKEQYKG
jgi:hypothetical protein